MSATRTRATALLLAAWLPAAGYAAPSTQVRVRASGVTQAPTPVPKLSLSASSVKLSAPALAPSAASIRTPLAVPAASFSEPAAPQAQAAAPQAESPRAPAQAAAEAIPVRKDAEKEEGFFRRLAAFFDGGKVQPAAPTYADYLGQAPDLGLPPAKRPVRWDPVRPNGKGDAQVGWNYAAHKDLGTGSAAEKPLAEPEDGELPVIREEEKGGLFSRTIVLPAGAHSGKYFEARVFWIDAQGRLAIHDIDLKKTKLYRSPSGPIDRYLPTSTEQVYVTSGKAFERLELFGAPKAVTVMAEGFDAATISDMVLREDTSSGVQATFHVPGGRIKLVHRGVTVEEGARRVIQDGREVRGLSAAGEGVFYKVEGGVTRVWQRGVAGSKQEGEDLGSIPLEARAVVMPKEKGPVYVATSEGLVEWVLPERRWRLIPVAEFKDAKDLRLSFYQDSVYASVDGKLLELRTWTLKESEKEVPGARTQLWSEDNPMTVKDGVLSIGEFSFPITRKPAAARAWYKRVWDRVLRRSAPPEVLDLGLSERDWKALNLPSNKRLIYDTLKGFTLNQHILYIGETGGGKTWIAEKLAKLTGNDLWMVSMNEYTRTKDLIARETFGEEGKNRTGLTMSTVLRWMTEGGILLLDEMHKPLEGIAVLNNILQNGEYRLPDGRVIKYDKRKSWIIGTMNPVKPPYKGEPPSGELSSRFGMTLEVKYLPPVEEEALLRIFHKGVPAELLRKLVSAANELRKLYPELLPLPIAPRTLMHIAEHAARYPQDGIADIFTKTYNPASIVEDPAIAQAIEKVLREQGLLETVKETTLSSPGRPDAKEIFKDRSPKPETPPSTTPPPSGHDWRWENQRDDGWSRGHMGFGHRHLPPMPFTSPKDRKVPPVTPEMEGWAASLQNLARMLAQYSPLRLVPFYYLEKHGERDSNTERRWRVVSGLEEIHYLPEEMGEADREVALGRTAHETWHLLFSRPELIFDEPDFINNMAFQALWWAVEDPRVNNLGLARHPGTRPWLEAAYDKDYQIRQLDFEREAWAQIPLHLQFNYALIYQWRYGKPDPRVTDARVLDALRRAGPAIRRAVNTENAGRAFDVIRDQIWPIYKELIEDQVNDETQDQQQDGQQGDQDQDQQDGDQDQQDGQEGQEGQEGQQGQQGKQGKQGKQQGKPQKEKTEEQKRKEKDVREKLEQKSKEYRDKHAPKTMDDPEKMSKEEREKAKKEAEKLREKMEKARKEKSEKGQKGPAQKGQPQPGQPGQGEGEASDGKADKSDPQQQKKQRDRLNKADEERKELNTRDRAHYQDYLRRVARLVPVMRQQLLHSLRQKLRQRTIHNRDEGDLDPDALPRIPKGDRDVFMEEYSPNKVLYRISLLIDTSGSMDGEKKERAMEGAVMMMEALEKIPGVVFEIVKYDSNPAVLKPFNKKLSPDLKAGVLASIRDGSGSTQAYQALKESIERVRLGKGDKMIIMVNDGDPDYNFDRDAYRKLIAESKDVEVHGIGLGPEAQLVLDLFPPGRGWWLKDAADFAKNLRNILRKKLAGH